MEAVSLIGFTSAKLIIAVSPGPGVLATVAVSLASGFRPALPVISGIIIGDIIYLIFAMTGLSAAAQALGEMFIIIKICGSAYFIWLGLKICFSNLPGKKPYLLAEKNPHSRNLVSGILITLSNPKVILFYYGFLPTLSELSKANIADIFIIISSVILVLAVVLLTYAYLAVQVQRRLFTNHAAVNRLNQASGGIFIATGILIVSRA